MQKVRATRVIGADSSRQTVDNIDVLVVPAVLTRESILPFCEGLGYRPAAELEAAAFTLNGAWVVSYEHIDSVFVMNRLDICGQVENVSFDKSNNSIKGDIRFFKRFCNQPFLDSVKAGTLKDVSVAYFCEEDFSPGEFGGAVYDFVQRNFMFGHVAAGVPEGRCPSPFCGLGCDSFKVKRLSPQVTDKFIRVSIRDPELFVEDSFRTIAVSAKEGVHAVVGKLRSDLLGNAAVQNYAFDMGKGWTLEKANAWVGKHTDSLPDTAGGLSPVEVLAQSRALLVYGNMFLRGDRSSVMTSAGWGARHHDGA